MYVLCVMCVMILAAPLNAIMNLICFSPKSGWFKLSIAHMKRMKLKHEKIMNEIAPIIDDA